MNMPRSLRYFVLAVPATMLLLSLALLVHCHQCTFSFYDDEDSLHQPRIEFSKPLPPIVVAVAVVIVVTSLPSLPIIAVEPLPILSRDHRTHHSGRAPPALFRV